MLKRRRFMEQLSWRDGFTLRGLGRRGMNMTWEGRGFMSTDEEENAMNEMMVP